MRFGVRPTRRSAGAPASPVDGTALEPTATRDDSHGTIVDAGRLADISERHRRVAMPDHSNLGRRIKLRVEPRAALGKMGGEIVLANLHMRSMAHDH